MPIFYIKYNAVNTVVNRKRKIVDEICDIQNPFKSMYIYMYVYTAKSLNYFEHDSKFKTLENLDKF